MYPIEHGFEPRNLQNIHTAINSRNKNKQWNSVSTVATLPDILENSSNKQFSY